MRVQRVHVFKLFFFTGVQYSDCYFLQVYNTPIAFFTGVQYSDCFFFYRCTILRLLFFSTGVQYSDCRRVPERVADPASDRTGQPAQVGRRGVVNISRLAGV